MYLSLGRGRFGVSHDLFDNGHGYVFKRQRRRRGMPAILSSRGASGLCLSTHVTKDNFVMKGMGSAEGGEWKPNPNKPQDERFKGKPGETKETTMPNGDKYKTKIGDDGKATKERHETDHNRPDKHSDPHDHDIDWSNGYPDLGPPINYPNRAPEFKSFEGVLNMSNIVVDPNTNQNFQTISEFKWCMKAHGEVEFLYNGRSYSITHPNGMIEIGEGYYLENGIAYNVANKKECIDMAGKQYNTADEALEYLINGERLRNIITKVEVTTRTI